MTGAARHEPFLQRTAMLIPVVVIGLLALPMAVTHRTFGTDWTLHLWMVRQQQFNIQAVGHPALFVSTTHLGAFYPIYAFVGSGIYSVGGYLAILFGDQPLLAYKLLYVVGLCMAYTGMTWLSLQRGLHGWRAQMSGAVFVTGAYYVGDMAVRGDMGAFMGLSSIPLVLAGTYAVLTSPKARLRHLLAVIGAVFVFTGSHNITLLWGSIFMALLSALMLVAYGPRGRRSVPWRRIATLTGCAIVGAGLNAWYLFPDLAYSLDTQVAKVSSGRLPKVYNFTSVVLDPLRRRSDRPFPWLFALWALLVVVAMWRGRDGASKRLFVGISVVTGAFAFLVLATTPWRWLPHLLYNLQFARRLGAYVLLGTALLVLLALEWHSKAEGAVARAATTVLAGLVVFTLGVAVWQVWSVRSVYISGHRLLDTNDQVVDRVLAARHVVSPTWRDFNSFRDLSQKIVTVQPHRAVDVPLAAVHGSKFSGVLRVPRGRAPFDTNISAGPRFVRMTGIEAVGRTVRGFVVAVRSDAAAPTGPITVTIAPAHNSLIETGDIVSIVSIVALVALIAIWASRLLIVVMIPGSAPSDPVPTT